MMCWLVGINPEEVNQDKKGFNRVYNPVDIIFKSKAGVCIYVGKSMILNVVGVDCQLSPGGERAARDLEILKEKNINAVVNCTDDIKNYHEGILRYYKFNIAWWRKFAGNSLVNSSSFFVF